MSDSGDTTACESLRADTFLSHRCLVKATSWHELVCTGGLVLCSRSCETHTHTHITSQVFTSCTFAKEVFQVCGDLDKPHAEEVPMAGF